MDTWRGRPDDDELKKLKKERQYIIFVPNPEDETNFSIMVVDTVSSHNKDAEKENFNVSNIIIKGIMYMLDSELDYLVEQGEKFILDEYEESMEETLKNSDNILMFDPRKTKH
tara:strand:+ start:2218 stop:2556 length:339 start_codon:yes stop_codon:yes gene_type:complete